MALALGSHASFAQISTEIASAAIDANKLASVAVACPEGMVALGGGTASSDPSGIEMTSSAPQFGETTLQQTPDGVAGAPTGWRGGAANDTETPGTVHVGALCAPDVEVTTVVASAAVPGGTFAGATADCPEGKVAIAGGVVLFNLTMRITETGPKFPSTGPLANAPEGENPAPTGWTAYARNPGGGSPLIKVAALCADLPDVFAIVVKRNTQANGGPALGYVDCPEGATALGGGLGSGNPLELTVNSSAPQFPGEASALSEQPDGTAVAPVGWTTLGRNDSDQVLSVTSAAICVPEPGLSLGSLAAILSLAGVARMRGVHTSRPSARRGDVRSTRSA